MSRAEKRQLYNETVSTAFCSNLGKIWRIWRGNCEVTGLDLDKQKVMTRTGISGWSYHMQNLDSSNSIVGFLDLNL